MGLEVRAVTVLLVLCYLSGQGTLLLQYSFSYRPATIEPEPRKRLTKIISAKQTKPKWWLYERLDHRDGNFEPYELVVISLYKAPVMQRKILNHIEVLMQVTTFINDI